MSAVAGMWAIVEQLGHRRLVGQLSEVDVAGAPMLRIDIPTDPPTFRLASSASLYGIIPITEEEARQHHTPTAPLMLRSGEHASFDEYIDDDDDDDDEVDPW